eukprot:COSAG06_NODE_20243_length_803_cov_0.801136_1_plen_145_part_10
MIAAATRLVVVALLLLCSARARHEQEPAWRQTQLEIGYDTGPIVNESQFASRFREVAGANFTIGIDASYIGNSNGWIAANNPHPQQALATAAALLRAADAAGMKIIIGAMAPRFDNDTGDAHANISLVPSSSPGLYGWQLMDEPN